MKSVQKTTEPVLQGMEYSMEYEYIDVALKARWPVVSQLLTDIAEFKPRPASDFEEERAAMIKRILASNPDSTEDSIVKIVDGQMQHRLDPAWQFHQRFMDTFMGEYVTVCMLSHALCEAAINAILAVGMASARSHDLFKLIERAEILDKWCIAPKSLDPSYHLPRNSAMFETLRQLTRQRNALVHHKIQVSVDGEKFMEGSGFPHESLQERIRWLLRFFSLPYDLATYARIHLPQVKQVILLDRRPIAQAAQHLNSLAAKSTA